MLMHRCSYVVYMGTQQLHGPHVGQILTEPAYVHIGGAYRITVSIWNRSINNQPFKKKKLYSETTIMANNTGTKCRKIASARVRE